MPTLTGVVEDGFGAAASDVGNGIYKLGYEPYPGTLNLRVGGVVGLGPPELTVEHSGTQRRLWPMTVAGICGHLLHADLPDVVELLAAVRLRDTLNLSNGDLVTVEVR